MSKILHNGRFVLVGKGHSQTAEFADCVVVDDASGKILHVGAHEDGAVQLAKAAGAACHDMDGKIVIPGLIDGHMHLVALGDSLKSCDVARQTSLERILATIQAYCRTHADLPRIVCFGWEQRYMTDSEALATHLDDLDARPVYVLAEDLHSAWLNTAALDEVGAAAAVDPPGGQIHRDKTGKPTGLLSETATHTLVWPFLRGKSSQGDKVSAIEAAFDAYIKAGYTGVVELAMDQVSWEALQLYRRTQPEGRLPIDLAAFWLIQPCNTDHENLEQVNRAVDLAERWNAETSPDCRVVGIKVICDGVVDACTAALQEDYCNGGNAETIWEKQKLIAVLSHADAAGLQCALHAIGDGAIKLAVDSLEEVGNPKGRHRIEHLETCSPEDAKRLGPLGIIASVQPVHSDPDLLHRWEALLGSVRASHVFPYGAISQGGAILAIGTDTPTASYLPLPNIYTATTRRSARDPQSLKKTTPQFALSLAAAISAATRGSAYSCFSDHLVGSIEKGKLANFAVIDMDWDAETLLSASVTETWVAAKRVFKAK